MRNRPGRQTVIRRLDRPLEEGFVDAADRRMVSVAWSRILSIEGQKTQFAIGSLPVGSAFAYEVAFTSRVAGHEAVWRCRAARWCDFPPARVN